VKNEDQACVQHRICASRSTTEAEKKLLATGEELITLVKKEYHLK
jgi:hypothetical protein